MSDLNERQTRFVRAYRETGNATLSAKRAGYSGDANALAVTGSKLLRHPKVAAEVAKADAKAEAHSLLQREARALLLAQIANGEVDDWEETRVDGVTSVGPARAKLVARLKALDQLSKMSGDYIETRKIVGADGGDVGINVTIARDEALSLARKKETP